MVKTRSNAELILDSIKKTVGTVDNPVHLGTNDFAKYVQYSAFTHAVEEYGKLLYLSRLTPNENEEYVVEYQHVGPSRGLFRWHKHKFQLAAESLGDALKVDRGTSTSSLTKNGSIQDVTVGWDKRVNVLDTDIDDDGEPTDIYSTIDLDMLRKGVESLYGMVSGFKIPK